MPITRQNHAQGEGQDSVIGEQQPVDDLPAVVQAAITDIESKFSSRLNQVEQGLTTQFDELKQLLQSRPEQPLAPASAAAPQAQPALHISADHAESPPRVALPVSAEIGHDNIAEEVARLRGELANIRERAPFSPNFIGHDLEGFPDKKFTVHNGSRSEAGLVPYPVVAAWDAKKKVTLELTYYLGANIEALLHFLLGSIEAVQGPDYAESDGRDYDLTPDDARLLLTSVRTALVDRVRGLQHIYELHTLLYDLLNGTDDSKYNTALVRHELKDRVDYLSSAQLLGRTETARKVELEASSRILERSIEQRIRNLSASDDRTPAKKAQDAKRRTADARRTAAAKPAAKDRDPGQSDATHNPRSRAQSRGRADAKDDVGAAK